MRYNFLIWLYLGSLNISIFIMILRGIIFKRPFLISVRPWFWFFGIFSSLLFFDIFFDFFYSPQERFAELEFISWVFVFAYVSTLAWMWFLMQGYTVYGVTNNSFREALFAALKAMNVQFQEDFSIIKIPAIPAEIQISFLNSCGCGSMRVKERKDQDFLQEVARRMNQYFKDNNVAINLVYARYQFLSAIFFLIMWVPIFTLATRYGHLSKLDYGKYYKEYYQTGELRYEYFYDSNGKQKQTKEYYQSGQLKVEWVFENGVLKQSKEYKEDGTLKGVWFYNGDKVTRGSL